ncbi:hypothetical protein AB0F43_19350 [Kribbella sp. NPDC023972]|uniref:hypothetical protein n=1 Tax=Kribbella sp. NPDC023972 TaxID=3154795 RepID=UPI0033C90029
MKLYRPATVLVGVLFVLLGGVTRLLAPDQVYDKQELQVVSGTIGETIKVHDSTFTVTRMKFAKTYLPDDSGGDDKPIDTNGVYVAVEWEAARGVKDPGSFDEILVADGGTIYEPVAQADDIRFPEPGFAKSGATVFEVNPTDVKGLTLQLDPVQFYNVLNYRVEVDLGIPSEDVAQQLLDGAAEQYVVQDSVERVAS